MVTRMNDCASRELLPARAVGLKPVNVLKALLKGISTISLHISGNPQSPLKVGILGSPRAQERYLIPSLILLPLPASGTHGRGRGNGAVIEMGKW